MSYHVKNITAKVIAEEHKVDGFTYPSPQSGGLEETDSAVGQYDVRSKLQLLAKSDRGNYALKVPNHKKYRVVLVQCSKGKADVLYELCAANEYSTAKEAFNKLNSSLTPLLACGSVVLTRDLLKEMIVPKPLHPKEMGLHLIEVMEKEPNSHPEWLSVIQAFVNNCTPGADSLTTTSTVTSKEHLSILKEKIRAYARKRPVNETMTTMNVDSLMAATAFIVPKSVGRLTGDDEVSNKVWTRFRLGTLEAKDRQAEDQSKTWLMDAVEKQYLKSSLNLVLSRVNTNDQHPSTGDTALHIAVRLGNVMLIKLILAYQGDPTIRNVDGKTPLDAAKKLTCKNADEIIIALESIQNLQAKVRSYKQCNHGLPKVRKSSDVFLLSLDGGGMRSVIMCHILAAIESRMHELSHSKQPLQSFFDYVAGTSAGAIVGALLMYKSINVQLLGMHMYKFMNEVFGRPKTERSDKLKQFITDMVGKDTVMSDLEHGSVIFTSTIANISPNKLHLMTSYGEARDGQKGPKERKVWEALLASSAAPTYFPAFEHFLDGGLMANNPTLPAMADIFKQAKKDDKKVKIGCVLSLGTGYLYPSHPVENFEVFVPGFTIDVGKSVFQSSMGLVNLFNHFVEQSTQSDGEVVREADAWCDSIAAKYFRFSPPLHQEVAPDMHLAEELISLLFMTELYILEEYSNIDKIAKTILTTK